MGYPPSARRTGPIWPRPADVMRELAGLLRGHGVTGAAEQLAAMLQPPAIS